MTKEGEISKNYSNVKFLEKLNSWNFTMWYVDKCKEKNTSSVFFSGEK